MSANDASASTRGFYAATIPNCRKTISGSTGGTLDLSAVTPDEGPNAPIDLRGRWVYMQAKTHDVTIARYAASQTQPASAGVGLVLTAGAAPQRFYIATTDDVGLRAAYASGGSLDIMFDSEVGP